METVIPSPWDDRLVGNFRDPSASEIEAAWDVVADGRGHCGVLAALVEGLAFDGEVVTWDDIDAMVRSQVPIPSPTHLLALVEPRDLGWVKSPADLLEVVVAKDADAARLWRQVFAPRSV